MEAANRGASEANGLSIGLNISLPLEQTSNPYITPDLNFEFHYFFMRKFWFVYLAKALIIFPGGFGTLDELFESLNLIQTLKIPPFPVILVGKKYWRGLLNYINDYVIKEGCLRKDELKTMQLVDKPKEVISAIKKFYKK